ncbi:alpha-hydroxy acid oxidase [Microbacterium candidum]|uniref:Alpha-hydroxy acid oxidase n=1 Tax=Microbacterium candidum TaxID=3041922 RepID=A0ABT7MWA9_9MICO|nr:alpha-hydroxy acid oxidase [Microbacterium sp. ASV49]MDL9978745.1 alpha-hydroxy acid oxidase [Microbacterium sp. ASV49]
MNVHGAGQRPPRGLRASLTVDDVRRAARRRVPRAVFDFVDGGADDEITMARARRAFDEVVLLPDVLRDVATVDTAVAIGGRASALPIAIGPTGYTGLLHPDGERAVSRAAAAAGIPYTLSTMGTRTIAEVRGDLPDAAVFFQLYFWKDRARQDALVAEAIEHRVDALVVTVDMAVGGARRRDLRRGLSMPPRISLPLVVDGALHPAWALGYLRRPPAFVSLAPGGSRSIAEVADLMFDPGADRASLERLRGQWPGRLIVKGVLTPRAAREAVAVGADEVVVSNHGGRQLDRAPAALECVARVRDAVGDGVAVHLDGGVRSGADVAAAVGLGADSVWLGRAALYGLMAGGEAGVALVLRLLADQLAATMRLLGAARLSTLPGHVALGAVRSAESRLSE